MRALSAAMPARRWPGPWKTVFSTARTAIASTRRARRRAPSARHSCGGSSASIHSLNTALSCACCIPHSRNCGTAPEPTAPGRFFRRETSEKPHDLIRGGPCPLERPRCSVDVSLCGIRRAAEALSGKCRRKPQNPIRGGPCPLERPRCFIAACMEWETRQKKRPPRSLNSGAGAAYFIRRETAAGTRAGCSSLPRTAKRHRRERACPCRSR